MKTVAAQWLNNPLPAGQSCCHNRIHAAPSMPPATTATRQHVEMPFQGDLRCIAPQWDSPRRRRITLSCHGITRPSQAPPDQAPPGARTRHRETPPARHTRCVAAQHNSATQRRNLLRHNRTHKPPRGGTTTAPQRTARNLLPHNRIHHQRIEKRCGTTGFTTAEITHPATAPGRTIAGTSMPYP